MSRGLGKENIPVLAIMEYKTLSVMLEWNRLAGWM